MSLLLSAALSAGIAGCGGKEEAGETTDSKPAQPAADKAAQAKQAEIARDARRSANAVTTGNAGAALDLQYELAPRPVSGQPFSLDLAFVPRLPADSLDAQLSATPGLRITSAESVRFEGVQAGERYTSQVLVVGDAPGLYYVGVVARMATQVQTDARTFSIPVVVGAEPSTTAKNAPSAEANPAPALDGEGQPIDPVSDAEPSAPET